MPNILADSFGKRKIFKTLQPVKIKFKEKKMKKKLVRNFLVFGFCTVVFLITALDIQAQSKFDIQPLAKSISEPIGKRGNKANDFRNLDRKSRKKALIEALEEVHLPLTLEGNKKFSTGLTGGKNKLEKIERVFQKQKKSPAGGKSGISLTVESSSGNFVQDPGYAMINLTPVPFLGCDYYEPREINAKGDVIGICYDYEDGFAPHLPRSWLYRNGQMTELTLGGSISIVTDINDNGDVIGTSSLPGDLQAHAFIYRNGQMIDIDSLGNRISAAIKINENGEVTGHFEDAGGYKRVFYYEEGVGMTDIGTLGGPAAIMGDINNLGEIVGASVDSYNALRSFLYRPDGAGMMDIGTLGLEGADARGGAVFINDNSEIAGMSGTADRKLHIFLYKSKTAEMIDLTPNAQGALPLGLNENGDVIGIEEHIFETAPGYFKSVFDAVLYKNGGAVNFSVAPGTEFGSVPAVEGINNIGQVIGKRETPNGDKSFLYSNNQIIELPHILYTLGEPGTLEFVYNTMALNDLGDVIGFAYVDVNGELEFHSILYRNDRLIDIANFTDGSKPTGSLGYLINKYGTVAGAGAIYHGNPSDEDFRVQVFPFIVKVPTKITVSAPEFIAKGGSVTISGVLSADTNIYLENQNVTFSVGSGTARQSCMATTDINGLASCTINNVNQPLGPNLPVKADFSGDPNYAPSSNQTTALVFAYSAPNGGAFVVGDGNANVGQSVTFWGSQWASKNTLTGGTAPQAFKGFAIRSSTTPASCGATWISSPGASSHPPSVIPEYMAVIAAGWIKEVGPQISGNTSKIVIVRKDPGSSKTGTIVGVLCR